MSPNEPSPRPGDTVYSRFDGERRRVVHVDSGTAGDVTWESSDGRLLTSSAFGMRSQEAEMERLRDLHS